MIFLPDCLYSTSKESLKNLNNQHLNPINELENDINDYYKLVQETLKTNK